MKMVEAINHKFKNEKKDIFIVLYGDKDFESRGNIVTFNIISKGDLLNHNLVSLILSDLFGIQIRSGCFCAGPFGIRLLNLSEETIEQLESEVSLGILKNKPGYCRLDLAFHFLPYEVEYLARALELIC
jgi:selenocysteine lyase/cysteine desulfurase